MHHGILFDRRLGLLQNIVGNQKTITLAVFTQETDYLYQLLLIHLQNPSKLTEKQMDKVRRIVHPNLRRE